MFFAHRFFFAHGLLATLLSTTHAAAVPGQNNALQPQNQVDNCKAVLLALKATSFCSSFNAVHDTTTTLTSTSSKVQVTTTTTITIPTPTSTSLVTLPPALITVTETSTSVSTTTTITTVTSVPAAKVRRGVYGSKEHQFQDRGVNKATSTLTSTTKANSCTIKGLPAQVTSFVCDVLSAACSSIVHPTTYKTTTTTTLSTSTSTITSTVTPSATTVTNTVTPPPDLTTATTATTITTTYISTATVAPPAPPAQYPQCEDTDDDGYGFTYHCNSFCIPDTDARIIQTASIGRFTDCVDFCFNASVNYQAGEDCEAVGDPCPDPIAILLAQYNEAGGSCQCYNARSARVITNLSTVGEDCAVPNYMPQ